MKVFVDFVDPRWKMTAAYQAAQYGSDGALRLLHGRRADLNAPTTDGEIGGRPVHVAAQQGHTGTVQLLANLRADINLRDGHPRPSHTVRAERGCSKNPGCERFEGRSRLI